MDPVIKLIPFVLAICVTLSAFAQPLFTEEGVTRAVVIGISDYEDERIPDLKYADRDAEAFAAWLQSPAGGSVPEENILLHVNEAATVAEIVMSIEWLIDSSQAGDRAFIYFSGHGDVERVTKYNNGYLLGYDTPATVYQAGAFSVRDLQDMVANLSENGVQVVLVTDACRAGKLAGSQVNGSQVTAERLIQQRSNEIKILSCQPDEYSLEGPQWGGGRGCFSYHLENALYGFADQNHDNQIQVLELSRYLQDKVSAEVAPESQIPFVQGPPKEAIAVVDAAVLAMKQENLKKEEPAFLAVENKGLEEQVLSGLDTSIYLEYEYFLAAIDSGFLMQPVGRSANDYYIRLMERQELEKLHGTIKRKFVVALADEAQVVVNRLLRTDPRVIDDAFPGRFRYDHLPDYLARAAEILGEEHYMYRYLKAKQLFFESKKYSRERYPDMEPDSLTSLSIRVLDEALAYDQEAAYLYFEKGLNYYWKVSDYKSALHEFEQAVQLSPTWVLGLYYRGYSAALPVGLEAAVPYLKKAIEYDSTFLPAYERLGYFSATEDEKRYWRERYVQEMEEMEQRDPDNVPAVYFRYAGLTLFNLGHVEEAERYLLKAAEMSRFQDFLAFRQLGFVYEASGRYREVCEMYEKAIELNPNDIQSLTSIMPCTFQVGHVDYLKSEHLEHLTIKNQHACEIYRYLLLSHRFEDSKRIGKEHLDAGGIADGKMVAFDAHGQWYYGSPSLSESLLREHIRKVEASGVAAEIAFLKESSPEGAYAQMVVVNLAQGDWEEADYWFDKRDREDVFQNPGWYDGWGYGLSTWLAYAQGHFGEVDSLIRFYAPRLNLADLIEDQLLLVSIDETLVDYSIYILEKTATHFPDVGVIYYHLARLYVEQKDNYEKGIPLLEKAAELYPGDPFVHYHLGAAYAHKDREAEALSNLKEALEAGYADWEELEKDERWTEMRKMKAFEELLETYLGD